MHDRSHRTAVTLVELATALFVVGILVALLIVAVQHSRASARRTQCQANLQQLGIGVHHFESVRGKLPGDDHSFLVQLLPYLGLSTLHDLHKRDEESLRAIHVPSFTCPSDGAPLYVPGGRQDASVNYVGNAGTWFNKAGFDGVFRYRAFGPPLALADIHDGTSNTSIVCESLRGELSWGRLRGNLQTSRRFEQASDLDDFARLCDSVPRDPMVNGWLGDPSSKGAPWTLTNMCITLYNHVLTPNHPSCFNGGDVVSGAGTVASQHPRGVNLLYVDGHVFFIADAIDAVAWRALGTRSWTLQLE